MQEEIGHRMSGARFQYPPSSQSMQSLAQLAASTIRCHGDRSDRQCQAPAQPPPLSYDYAEVRSVTSSCARTTGRSFLRNETVLKSPAKPRYAKKLRISELMNGLLHADKLAAQDARIIRRCSYLRFAEWVRAVADGCHGHESSARLMELLRGDLLLSRRSQSVCLSCGAGAIARPDVFRWPAASGWKNAGCRYGGVLGGLLVSRAQLHNGMGPQH